TEDFDALLVGGEALLDVFRVVESLRGGAVALELQRGRESDDAHEADDGERPAEASGPVAEGSDHNENRSKPSCAEEGKGDRGALDSDQHEAPSSPAPSTACVEPVERRREADRERKRVRLRRRIRARDARCVDGRVEASGAA